MSCRLATFVALTVLLASITTLAAPARAAQPPSTATTISRMGAGSIVEIASAVVRPRTGLFAHPGNSSVDPFPKNDITYPQDIGVY